MGTNKPKKIELSTALRQFMAEADVNGWELLEVGELNTEGAWLSFRPLFSAQWQEGKVGLLVKRGKTRLSFPVEIKENGKFSAELSRIQELICSEKDRSAAVALVAEDEKGNLKGWLLFSNGLDTQKREQPKQSSMLIPQLCRHLPPVARKTVEGKELCAQPYLQLDSKRLLIQFTTVYRAERMAGERWTQSREEYHGEEKWRVSVILSADAGVDLLRESVNSLLEQEIGFQAHIQVVLCDFGNDQEVTELCKEYQNKYPKNIFIEDVSGCTGAEAKNRGMKQAKGKYMIFLSARNRLTPESCGPVCEFADQNYQVADVFVIPTVMSGAQIKEYWRNTCLKTTQIINLEDTSNYVQCTLGATFLKREAAQNYRFEAEEAAGGDTLFLLKLMADKCSIGLCSEGQSIYHCTNKEREPKAWEYAAEPMWYDQYFDNLPGGVMDYCRETKGWVPDFIPCYLVTELVWRLRQKKLPDHHKVKLETYRARLKTAFQQIEDRMILAVKKQMTSNELEQIFQIKYDEIPQIDYYWHDGMMRVHGNTIGSLAMNPVTVDFIDLDNKTFSMEGFIPLPASVEPERVSVWLKTGSQWIACTQPKREMETTNCMGKLFNYISFYGETPITHELMEEEIVLYYAIDEHLIRCRYLSLKKYSPLNSYFSSQYYYKDGIVLTKNNSSLMLHSCKNLTERMRYERVYMEEVRRTLAKLPPYHPLAQVDVEQVARLRHKAIVHKMNPWHNEIWLVSDRINRGDDNGEIFFKYMQSEQKKRGRKVYFVIEKECEDYQRIRKMGPVVEPLSEEHKMKHLMSDWVISSQANDPVIRPFGAETVLYQDLCHDFKFAFLQHGVIKDDLSGWLNRYNRKMEGFVVTTKPEYDSILDYNYYQDAKNVWLTGLPRHDALYHDEKKYITIMPTWRKSLTKGIHPVTSVWLVVDDFQNSAFYQFYNGLLNHPRLLEKAEELGYTLCFKPHPNFLSVLDQFQKDPRVVFFEESKSYREVYAQTDLILTDYSSAIFDFVLMNKPVIYSQFDAADFFNGSHSYVEGYYDYQRDGFGEVEHDLEGTVNRIIEYMENGCQVKPKYQERIQNTFAFHDHNNSQRVYEKIMEHSPVKRVQSP